MRLEAASRALELTDLPLKNVAVQSGYGDERAMRSLPAAPRHQSRHASRTLLEARLSATSGAELVKGAIVPADGRGLLPRQRRVLGEPAVERRTSEWRDLVDCCRDPPALRGTNLPFTAMAANVASWRERSFKNTRVRFEIQQPEHRLKAGSVRSDLCSRSSVNRDATRVSEPALLLVPKQGPISQ